MTNTRLIARLLFLGLLFLAVDFILFSTLKKGMDTYYGMNKEAEILLVGHSHIVLGIDAERLETELNIPVAKYATAGANVLDRYWMLHQFIDSHPSVKTVVYGIGSRLFDSAGLSSASYTLFLPYIDDPAISRYLKTEATWQEYYSSRLIRTARFRDQTINIALRGLLGKTENKKNSLMQIANYQQYLEREKARPVRINPESVQCFYDTIDYLTARGITVLLVFIPVVDLLNDIDRPNQENAITIFRQTADKNKNVYFIDYNKEYQHNYALFYDLRHLNEEGNELVTGRLIEDFRRITSSDDRQTDF